MDYYSTMRNDLIHRQMYPNDPRVDFVPKGPYTGSNVTIRPKPTCVPRFTTKIEGNAVEEGARMFFEGIVDAQPYPVFSWYFNDEAIHPGTRGWEDASVHDSHKMSTLILAYVREHHMGKYTLVAQNQLGHAQSVCDLIVRKKQFPPVFWKRLYNYETVAGTRILAEVEVGGWPVPEVTWHKDQDPEPLVSMTHTENYNGHPNRYVPEARFEVLQLDQVRHCILFHRVRESQAGTYTVRAVNPLGEALCEAEVTVEPGEGGSTGDDMYLPEKWRAGSRYLTWAEEDRRAKPFVGHKEPELTDEDIREMTKRVASTPLPRAIEYLASLPDYRPTTAGNFVTKDGCPALRMEFGPEPVHVRGSGGGRRPHGGQAIPAVPRMPARFTPGRVEHRELLLGGDYVILPLWVDPRDRLTLEWVKGLRYQRCRADLPDLGPPLSTGPPPEPSGPPCPHQWETHEEVDRLYRMLDTVGCRILTTCNTSTTAATLTLVNSETSYSSGTASYSKSGSSSGSRGPQQGKFSYLKAPAVHPAEAPAVAPSLPPKTKIMNSPSRHLFSPTHGGTAEDNDPGKEADEEDTYVPVKEKIRMITQQQEEIVMREEMKRMKMMRTVEDHSMVDGGPPVVGGVRILPPPPPLVPPAAPSVQVQAPKDDDYNEAVAAAKETTSKVAKTSSSASCSSASMSQETVYNVQVTSRTTTQAKEESRQVFLIPCLEDKYGAPVPDQGQQEVDLTCQRTGSTSSRSREACSTSTTMTTTTSTTRSAAMTAEAAALMTATNLSQSSHSLQSLASEHSSVRTMKDSSYSTASSFASSNHRQHTRTVVEASPAAGKEEASSDLDGPSDDPLDDLEDLAPPPPGSGDRGCAQKQPAADAAAGREPQGGSTPSESPATARRTPRPPRVSTGPDSPPVETKYRTPPSTPFQPKFYKVPSSEDEFHYKLPEKKISSRSSSASKRFKRKKRQTSENGQDVDGDSD